MTALQLPAATAIEVGAAGAVVRGIRWDWAESDLALLMLHEIGSDLDDLRWLADRLIGVGTSVLSIDLPGHGLSDGETLVPAAGSTAIRAVLAELNRTIPGVAAIVAQGRSAGLLLRTELASPPVAAILIDPDPLTAGDGIAESWRLVPKLLLIPADGGSAPFITEIVDATNAWTLRADLHGLTGPQRTEIAEIQAASLSLKFALELAAFELAGRRAAESG
jgi:pimeloyl-ACP methyl ester carboxylesterase